MSLSGVSIVVGERKVAIMALIKDAARQAADEVLEQYWDGRLPVDPVAIAERLGLRVWTANLGEGVSGEIVKRESQPADIYLERSESPGRQAFTCAHEIGHFWDRDRHNDGEFSYREQRGQEMTPTEWFAEHFAVNLLMPEPEFVEARKRGLSVHALAKLFGVSRLAATNRIKHLGLDRG